MLFIATGSLLPWLASYGTDDNSTAQLSSQKRMSQHFQWESLVRSSRSPWRLWSVCQGQHSQSQSLRGAVRDVLWHQSEVQRGFFSQRALSVHLLTAHGQLPSIRQYIGPDKGCPVCLTTFPYRYTALVHRSHVKPRTCATRSRRQVV